MLHIERSSVETTVLVLLSQLVLRVCGEIIHTVLISVVSGATAAFVVIILHNKHGSQNQLSLFMCEVRSLWLSLLDLSSSIKRRRATVSIEVQCDEVKLDMPFCTVSEQQPVSIQTSADSEQQITQPGVSLRLENDKSLSFEDTDKEVWKIVPACEKKRERTQACEKKLARTECDEEKKIVVQNSVIDNCTVLDDENIICSVQNSLQTEPKLITHDDSSEMSDLSMVLYDPSEMGITLSDYDHDTDDTSYQDSEKSYSELLSLNCIGVCSVTDEESCALDLHSSLLSEHCGSQMCGPPADENQDVFSKVLEAYDAVNYHIHGWPFVRGCIISSGTLLVLVSDSYQLEECYQQVMNGIPQHIERDFIDVKHLSAF